MHFESLGDFFAMGGYASYVWSAFGITFLSMIILLVTSVSRGKNFLKTFKLKSIGRRVSKQRKIWRTLYEPKA